MYSRIMMSLVGCVSLLASAHFLAAQTPERLDLNAPNVSSVAGKSLTTDWDGSKLLRFSAPSPQQNDYKTFPLILEHFRGRRLRLKAEVEASNVGVPLNPWNGVKVMLHIQTPTEDLWRQLAVPTGTFDWRSFSALLAVPTNATSVDLVLGLSQASGNIRIRNVSLTPIESATTALAAPNRALATAAARPVFTGHASQGLRGAMVDAHLLKRADFDTLTKTWGANLVRWPLIRSLKEPRDLASYKAWLDTQLAELDQALTWAAANGTKVVVDLHSPPEGGQSGGGYYNASGELFSTKKGQDDIVAIWQQITTRYLGNDTIWGFDLVNEPTDTDTADDCLEWNGLALRIATAIRKIDPTRVLIVESPLTGTPEGMEWLLPLPMDRIIYSFHMYDPLTYTHQGVPGVAAASNKPAAYPGIIDGHLWNRDALVHAMQPAISFAAKYHVQVYVGEFGAVRWAPGGDTYLSDLISIFEEQHWDWSFHAFREWQGWNPELGSDRANNTPLPDSPRVKLFKSAFRRNQR
jgi:hypothetical protein